MILDERLELCDGSEALTATGVIGDVVDTWANASGPGSANTLRDLGNGEPLYCVLRLVTAITGTTPQADFVLVTDSEETLTTSRTTHITFPALDDSSAVGTEYVVPLPALKNYEQFLGIYMTETGTITAGAVEIFIVRDVASWKSYADNIA